MVFVYRRLDGGSQRGELRFVTFERLGFFANSLDGELSEFVTLGNGVNHVLPIDDATEYGVLAIKPRCRLVSDEKLAAIGAGAGVGHRKNPRAAVAK